MHVAHLSLAAALALVGTHLVTGTGQAASIPARPGQSAHALPLELVGKKERAIIGGAIVGGALGVMLGTALSQPGHAAPPPPAPEVVEEEDEEELSARPVVVSRRPARRTVEVEEEATPQVVEEEECVVRRTKIYDPASGRMVVRKESDCE